MKDPSGSDRELIKEISVLKKRVRDLERSKTGGNETGEAAGVNNLYPLSVLDAHPYPIYVCDPESYELLYCNRVLVESRGEPGRKKCYEYLQDRRAPCPFCTNDKILGENLGKNFVWDFQSEISLRWYRCLDRAITWADGRIVRYELAVDNHRQKRSRGGA